MPPTVFWALPLVPLADGRFDLDDYIDYLISIFRALGPDCPSSNDLRPRAVFEDGGSGPSGFKVKPPARDGASGGRPGSVV